MEETVELKSETGKVVDESAIPVPVPETGEKKKKNVRKTEEIDLGKKKKRPKSDSPTNNSQKALKNGVKESAGVGVASLSKFNISVGLRERLKSMGVDSLIPIQARTYETVLNGSDVVLRAPTGLGKTLAFVLPVLMSLTHGEKVKTREQGRSPSVLVLAPTRELANQVYADFETYGKVVGLNAVCAHGGAPHGPQENAMRNGVDIVVGTPNRIKDLLERGSLSFKDLKVRILDEADEILNLGFEDDVEFIMKGVEDPSMVQTLLFSVTFPDRVEILVETFMKEDRVTVDLVGEENVQASSSVKHLLLPGTYSMRTQLVKDVISCYGKRGRVIVFTENKSEAGKLSTALMKGTSRTLHADVALVERKKTLSEFREGKFSVLVTTDHGFYTVNVQLVVQCEPPRDAETYIQRSGRTGRDGTTGTSILFYDKKKEHMIPLIERQAGVKFERIAPPQPADLAKASFDMALHRILAVNDSVLPLYRELAKDLVARRGLPALDLLSITIAQLTGQTELKRRSFFSSHDNCTTLMLKAKTAIESPTHAFNFFRMYVPESFLNEVKRMTLTADGMGAVFDVPHHSVEVFTEEQEDEDFTVEILDSMPELQVKSDRAGNSDNRFGGRVDRRGGFGGRDGGGGRFKRS